MKLLKVKFNQYEIIIVSIAIGHAFAILGDPDKRSSFDRYGIDSDRGSNNRASGFRGFDSSPFEAEISPEDIFRMFMGNEFPGFGKLINHRFCNAIYSISNRSWI